MKVKRLLANVIMALTLAVSAGAIAGVPAYAAPAGGGGGGGGGGGTPCPDNQTAKGQVLKGLGQTGSNCSDDQVNSTLRTVVTILSLVVGMASVIVIILAGFKYIVSAGDQNRVSSAKSTLLYAMVGLAVAALAQLLIQFVLYQTNK